MNRPDDRASEACAFDAGPGCDSGAFGRFRWTLTELLSLFRRRRTE